MRKNELDSITHFGNTSALTGESIQTKKRKGPKFAAKKGGSKKKRK